MLKRRLAPRVGRCERRLVRHDQRHASTWRTAGDESDHSCALHCLRRGAHVHPDSVRISAGRRQSDRHGQGSERRRHSRRDRHAHEHGPRQPVHRGDGWTGRVFVSERAGRPLRLDDHARGFQAAAPRRSGGGHQQPPADRRHARDWRTERDGHGHGDDGACRDDLDADRRSRAGRDDDDALAQRPELHRPAGHPAGRDSGHDDAVRLDHHGRRHRRGGAVGAAQSRQPVDQRPARVGEQLPRQRQRRAGADERRHLDCARPRLGRSVPRAHQQLRSPVRQLQRRHRQRDHQVRQRRLPRQRLRFRPQHVARREELFLARARRVQAAAAWRHDWRSGQERQGVLLRRLSGHAHHAGDRDRSHSRADAGRTGREFLARPRAP